jgi:NAD+ synthase
MAARLGKRVFGPTDNPGWRRGTGLPWVVQTGSSTENICVKSESMTTETLRLDADAEIERIAEALRAQVAEVLKRRGLVVAMSGGIDSSVCAGLAVRALGAGRVFGLMLPERDSDPGSEDLAAGWACELGMPYAVENIAPALDALGCYARRDEAIRAVVPEYGTGWACKIVLPTERLSDGLLNVSYLAIRDPHGETRRVRLSPTSYRQIVAATNFKQRVRKMLEYYHADRLHYAVVGTPNRLEYDQGFFVKGGDGLADVKPIAHLYKTQVYQLADALGVPAAITSRPPTTDTFPLAQSQEEFYFSLPLAEMDMVLHGVNNGIAPAQVADQLGLPLDVVERAYTEVGRKRSSTQYLHLAPLLVAGVDEVSGRRD